MEIADGCVCIPWTRVTVCLAFFLLLCSEPAGWYRPEKGPEHAARCQCRSILQGALRERKPESATAKEIDGNWQYTSKCIKIIQNTCKILPYRRCGLLIRYCSLFPQSIRDACIGEFRVCVIVCVCVCVIMSIAGCACAQGGFNLRTVYR
jgi:hypothetical protein